MSLKIKLTSTILAFMLILGLLVMGVFATSQATVNLGGSLSFSATNVHAKITGSVSGADNDEEANSKLPDLTFMEGRDSTAEDSHKADVLSWADAGLQFNENGDAISIVLSIENLATDRAVYGTISLDSEMSTAVKSTITRVENESATTGELYQAGELITLEPQAEGNTSKLYFRLVIELKDKNTSLTSGSKWGYDIALDSTTTKAGVENTNAMLAYTKGAYNTLSVAAGTTAPSGSLSIEDYIIQNGYTYAVTSLEYNAFWECANLTSITIPDSVVGSLSNCINSCPLLETIIIGNGVSELTSHAFAWNEKLKNVTIGNSVEIICMSSFDQCTSLTELKIPENVKIVDMTSPGTIDKLATVTIDSQDVVNLLVALDSAGSLIQYATTINIRADLTPTEYLTSLGTPTDKNIGGIAYKTYTKTI